ncbi:hypothetical protein [Kitasatospora sp. NPDC059827]|uniref:hypothetical protein n=1 Tax=Kitasatospora sp. NPDC059827 TaxID=3346964 RepID=UPI00365F4129
MSIDTVTHGMVLYTGVVKNGTVQVGSAPLNGPNANLTTWSTPPALPLGATPACGVAVSDHGNQISVETITTDGTVYRTFCDFANGSTPVDCVTGNPGWTAITNQPARLQSGAPPFGTEEQQRSGDTGPTRSIKVVWEPYVRRTS